MFICVIQLIFMYVLKNTRLQLHKEKMAVMAVAQEKEISDMLTELYNKRYFETIMNTKVQRGNAFALIYLDLDYFKPVNDTYGHQAGDEVLRNVGKRILNSIRNDDYVFRLGGDEFACIIGGNPDEKNCLKSIERLEKNICSPYNIHGHKIQIGVSCGYAVYPSDGDTVECMLKIADSRMYSEKEKHHAGRISFPAQPQV